MLGTVSALAPKATSTPLQGILLALAPLLPASSSPSAAGPAGPPAQLSAQAPIPAAEQLSSHRSAQEGDIALGLAGRRVPRPDLSTQPCSPEGTSSVTALSLDGPRVGRGGLPPAPHHLILMAAPLHSVTPRGRRASV